MKKFELIDTHCHVHFQAYKDDMDAVVKRALDAGVGMISVGTQSTTSENGIKLAERYDGVWTTIGLHPNHLHVQEFLGENELPPGVKDDVEEGGGSSKIKTRAERFDPSFYEKLVSHPKVVAIGEFGLDYYRIPEGSSEEQVIADQKESVKQQLAFASRFDKPVVIHCRDAHKDQFELLKAEIDNGGLKRRGVIHCFTGTPEDAERYHSIGFLLSITGIVTFAHELQESVRRIPLEQLMIETDSPYLTPAPFRGKRNEPIHVRHIAKKISELKDVSIERVARITTKNAVELFGLTI